LDPKYIEVMKKFAKEKQEQEAVAA